MTGTGDRWFFDRVAPLYDRLMWRADPEALQRGLDHAERTVRRVVDVAGGTGRASASLSARERIVLDASLPMLRRAADRGRTVVAGDAARLPLRANSVDAVLVVDALHHVPDVDGTLAEAARVLRPGGVLVVREFDPATAVGRAIEFGEAVAGMDSTFYEPAALAERIERAGLQASLPEGGWTYTAVGVRR